MNVAAAFPPPARTCISPLTFIGLYITLCYNKNPRPQTPPILSTMKTSSTTRRREPANRMPQDDTRPPADDLSPEAEEDAGEGYPDMARVCRILARQVEALDAMFHHTRQLALREDGATEAYERLSRLALRAQAQTARTVAVLGRLVPVVREPDPVEEEFMRVMMRGNESQPCDESPVEWGTGDASSGQSRS